MIILLYMSILFTLLFIYFIKSKESKKIKIYNKVNNIDDGNGKRITIKKQKKIKEDFSHLINLPPILLSKYKARLIIACFLILSIWALSIIFIDIDKKYNIHILIFIAIASIITPNLIKNTLLRKKKKLLVEAIPLFIDMVAACVQAGMTIESALTHTAKNFESINRDLSMLFNNIMKKSEIIGLEKAIKEVSIVAPSTEIKMFCSTLQYSLSFGSTVYEQLNTLSTEIKNMQLLIAEEILSKLSAKLTLPLFLFIVIPFIALILSPSILGFIYYADS
ncbi:type II secretion system (T2SS), F family protein [Yersinia ruckeri]|uniref:type II secretion system F family protein n=1 Tax=Yersinia ruckeri TaxID=29486 RepID=UPI0005AC1BB8|nr:type II secretion system F family protein [Yersinia ruckeri]AJI94614.1 type II secretion system (T2SS), F family protein [Yersinia ruckeri]MCW6567515.1 type II secretion system F family protein [Yersinia ruckeri]